MAALGATALATTTVAGAGAAGCGGGGGQRTSVALAAASIVARQERALKWSQGVLARALETREASFRCVKAPVSNPAIFGLHRCQTMDGPFLICLCVREADSYRDRLAVYLFAVGHLRCDCVRRRVSSVPGALVVATRRRMS